MRWLPISAALVLAIVIAGCGGDEGGTTVQGGTTSSGEESDESAITRTAEKWAEAYATNDPAYCEFTPKGDVSFCRNVLAGGEPTVYQTGYLNSTVNQIDLDSSDQGIVTLSNGCKIEVADEGGGDWRVSNSGGALARGCEQGTGR
ncbi:MAG: hypothetical protein ACRDQZ_22165 [Mycobacteriales bacterium]